MYTHTQTPGNQIIKRNVLWHYCRIQCRHPMCNVGVHSGLPSPHLSMKDVSPSLCSDGATALVILLMLPQNETVVFITLEADFSGHPY